MDDDPPHEPGRILAGKSGSYLYLTLAHGNRHGLLAVARKLSNRRLQRGENRIAHLGCRKNPRRAARDIGGAQPLFEHIRNRRLAASAAALRALRDPIRETPQGVEAAGFVFLPDARSRSWVIILDASPPHVFTMNVAIQLDIHKVPAELRRVSL